MSKIRASYLFVPAFFAVAACAYLIGNAQLAGPREAPVLVDGRASDRSFAMLTKANDYVCSVDRVLYLLPNDGSHVYVLSCAHRRLGSYLYVWGDVSIYASEIEPYGDWRPSLATSSQDAAFYDLAGHKITIKLQRDQ